MVTPHLQRQLVKLFERGNLHCGTSVHWSVETIQQQIQFTECCGHLSSLSLFHYDFSAFLLKFAGIMFTLVKTLNHCTPKQKQFCPVFTWFPLLVCLEHAYTSYSEIFSDLKCWNVQKFALMLQAFSVGEPLWYRISHDLLPKYWGMFHAPTVLEDSVPAISRRQLIY